MRLSQEFVTAIKKAGNFRKLPHNEIQVVTMSHQLTLCDNRVVAALTFLDSNCIDKAVPLTRRNVRRAIADIGRVIGFATGRNQVNAID